MNILVISAIILIYLVNNYVIYVLCKKKFSKVIRAKENLNENQVKMQRESYISTLSHDLKIPTLAQIRALDLLLKENVGKINSEQREIINLTLGSCKFMYDMLSTILSTYKFENEEVVLNEEKTLLFNLLEDCLYKSHESLKSKNLKIRIKQKDELAVMLADRKQIRKAFENIIAHCVSSAMNNTEIICEFKKSYDRKFINISLAFESPYVSAETLKNMFNMYNTPADKLDKVGSGLRLYLAKKIIEAHNGNVYVKSTAKNFFTYQIQLPCCVNECKIHAEICKFSII